MSKKRGKSQKSREKSFKSHAKQAEKHTEKIGERYKEGYGPDDGRVEYWRKEMKEELKQAWKNKDKWRVVNRGPV